MSAIDVGLKSWKAETFAHIFIRNLTPAEKKSNAVRNKGWQAIPKRTGYEVVYKPYGNDGKKENAGFYYFGKQ